MILVGFDHKLVVDWLYTCLTTNLQWLIGNTCLVLESVEELLQLVYNRLVTDTKCPEKYTWSSLQCARSPLFQHSNHHCNYPVSICFHDYPMSIVT